VLLELLVVPVQPVVVIPVAIQVAITPRIMAHPLVTVLVEAAPTGVLERLGVQMDLMQDVLPTLILMGI